MTEDDPRHGTTAGYKAHQKAGQTPCAACYAANAYYHRHLLYDVQRGRRRVTPAIGSRRRIQALQRLGWSLRVISREGGWGGQTETFRYILLPTTATVFNSTARAIAEVYDRLSMRLPPPSSGAVRARLAAERKGYPPPLAWDDETIDDPVHSPVDSVQLTNGFNVDEAVVVRVLDGEHLPTNRVEKQEIVRRWLARGGSERTICTRMGWKQGRYTQAPVNDGAGVVGKPGNDENSAQRKAS